MKTEQEQLDSIMRGEDSILATQKPTANNTLDDFPGLNNQGQMSATAMTFVGAEIEGAFEDEPQNVNEVYRSL